MFQQGVTHTTSQTSDAFCPDIPRPILGGFFRETTWSCVGCLGLKGKHRKKLNLWDLPELWDFYLPQNLIHDHRETRRTRALMLLMEDLPRRSEVCHRTMMLGR